MGDADADVGFLIISRRTIEVRAEGVKGVEKLESAKVGWLR